MRMTMPFALPLAVLAWAGAALSSSPYQEERERLVRQIERDVQETSSWVGKDRLDEKVMKSIAGAKRHLFVPEKHRDMAYLNRPLPIGHGQTISQPYIVALMTDLLDVDGDDVVLEVGTGSGYQAAVLSPLVKEVHTIEIIPELGRSARERLERLGYDNVTVKVGDGYYGWPERAPFDAIVVTAAADHVPPPLVRQLKPGGRMVIPVGGRFMAQQLTFVEKAGDGTVTTRQVLPVRFVPLTGRR
ncbi:MAG: protein-L-isoaspartate(D-aspartate) O-methyltransferase [Candidatus Nitrospinota bacterium M3_3B_026]